MSKPSILMVDGDTRGAKVLEMSLKQAGFAVTLAATAEEALQKISTIPPDIVISETELRTMDGFSFCMMLKQDATFSSLPFVFLSEQGHEEYKLRSMQVKADDFIAKPVFIRELVLRLRALLHSRQHTSFIKDDQASSYDGELEEMAVVDLIQSMEVGNRSGIISLQDRYNHTGAFYFREGQIIDAEFARHQGEAAVYRLLGWSSGRFTVEIKEIRRRDTVRQSNQLLILEGLRRVDEWAKLASQLPAVDTIFQVDYQLLAERLGEIPDEANSILRLIDGRRNVLQIVDECTLGDLETLQFLIQFFQDKLITEKAVSKDRASKDQGTGTLHFVISKKAQEEKPRSQTLPGVSTVAQEEKDAETSESKTTPDNRMFAYAADLHTQKYGQTLGLGGFSPSIKTGKNLQHEIPDDFAVSSDTPPPISPPPSALGESAPGWRTSGQSQEIGAQVKQEHEDKSRKLSSREQERATGMRLPIQDNGFQKSSSTLTSKEGSSPGQWSTDSTPLYDPHAEHFTRNAQEEQQELDKWLNSPEREDNSSNIYPAAAQYPEETTSQKLERRMRESGGKSSAVDQFHFVPVRDTSLGGNANASEEEIGRYDETPVRPVDVATLSSVEYGAPVVDTGAMKKISDMIEAKKKTPTAQGPAVAPLRGVPPLKHISSDAKGESQFFDSDYQGEEGFFDPNDPSIIEQQRKARKTRLITVSVIAAVLTVAGVAIYLVNTNPYLGNGPRELQINSVAANKNNEPKELSNKDERLAQLAPAEATKSADNTAVEKIDEKKENPSPAAASSAKTASAATAVVSPAATPSAKTAPAAALASASAGSVNAADKSNYQTLLAAALELKKKRRPEGEVFKAFKKAAEENEDGWEAYQEMAMYQLDQGATGRALKFARQAEKANPDAPYAQLVIGAVMQERGKNGEAKEAYEKFVKLCPTCPQANEIRRVLNSL